MRPQAEGIVKHFPIKGNLLSVTPFGSGHIHDTFVAVYDLEGGFYRFILQRINRHVFKDPPSVMDNIARVSDHLKQKLKAEGERDWKRRALLPIPARGSLFYFQDQEGEFWRMYEFIERGETFDMATNPAQAFQAAKAFGSFQKILSDLPPPRLHETIPDFHNTPKRLRDFISALESDSLDRAKSAKPEIKFAIEHDFIAPVLINLHNQGQIPERVIHNDAKINNVVFDVDSGEGICVIDLDTVMPGLALYDFGDLVRSAGCPMPEDEEDLSKVYIHPPLFASLAGGYLSGVGDTLTSAEKENLVTGAKLICYEQGLRFLADYLSGDVYYKTSYPKQNLRRARAQFKLVESLAENEETLQKRASQ